MKISGKKGMDDELTTEVTNSNSSMMYKMTYGKSLLAIKGLNPVWLIEGKMQVLPLASQQSREILLVE